MMRRIPDETETETEIRQTICKTCEDLGISTQKANAMADRVIGNLREDSGSASTVAAMKEVEHTSPPEPSSPDSKLITRLLERWQDR